MLTAEPIAMRAGTRIGYTSEAPGLRPLGALSHRLVVRRDLEAILDFRARRVHGLSAAPPGPAVR